MKELSLKKLAAWCGGTIHPADADAAVTGTQIDSRLVRRGDLFVAIAGERVRLAMGLPLRPVDQHTVLSEGVTESAIAEKYYDPPLINIINFACHACPTRQYRVTEYCQGCLAQSCHQV